MSSERLIEIYNIEGETQMATIKEEVTGTNSIAIIGTAHGENTLGVQGNGDAIGVQGIGIGWHGVEGLSDSTTGGAGVHGFHRGDGAGVVGESNGRGIGVFGRGNAGAGVEGRGDPGPGVIGTSSTWVGVYGETAGLENGPAGVWGEHKGGGIGVKAVSMDGTALAAFSNGTAGFFQGNVEVTGDIRLTNADCAEEFSIADHEAVQPGTVMILCDDEGNLQTSQQAYDKRVAGVVSGAGNYRPGIVLDRQDSQPNRMPIALLGKVYCKVDASYTPIEVGDLLTTAPTPGHAMKALDPLKAFGAVIGKALRPLNEGQGLIPILIALQ
jgi:hypothetical protein